MSKSNTQESDQFAALESRLAKMEAENTAKNEVIAALLQGNATNDVVAKLLERIEGTDPAKERQRMQQQSDAMCDAAARAQLKPWQEAVTGATPFFVSVMEPGRPDSKMRNPHPMPMPGMTRLVYVPEGGDAAQAIGKYEKLMGIADPGIFGLNKYMEGVFPSAVLATAQEAGPVRKRCLEYIDRADDIGKLAKLMIEVGESVFASRLPKPEVETLEAMLTD